MGFLNTEVCFKHGSWKAGIRPECARDRGLMDVEDRRLGGRCPRNMELLRSQGGISRYRDRSRIFQDTNTSEVAVRISEI